MSCYETCAAPHHKPNPNRNRCSVLLCPLVSLSCVWSHNATQAKLDMHDRFVNTTFTIIRNLVFGDVNIRNAPELNQRVCACAFCVLRLSPFLLPIMAARSWMSYESTWKQCLL